MKHHINITVDLDAYIELRKQKINISQLVSDYLVAYANVEKPEVEGKTEDDKVRNLKLQRLWIEKELEKIQRDRDKEAKDMRNRKIIPLKEPIRGWMD